MTIDTTKLRELAQKAEMTAENRDDYPANYARFIAAANPATVLALLDEVEKQKSRADILEETVHRLQQYVIFSPTIDKDRVRQLLTVGSHWVFCLRNYLSDANMELDRLTEEVSKLRAIEAAARNLVKVKGRHNTEIAMTRLLAALAATE